MGITSRQAALDITGNATTAVNDDVNWDGTNASALTTPKTVLFGSVDKDSTGNKVSYVIHRLCEIVGSINARRSLARLQRLRTAGSTKDAAVRPIWFDRKTNRLLQSDRSESQGRAIPKRLSRASCCFRNALSMRCEMTSTFSSGNTGRWAVSVSLAVASWILPGTANSAPAVIATEPVTQLTTNPVKPNIMFILDDSGSMDWTHMPDESADPGSTVIFSYGFCGYRSPQCNRVYYNPAFQVRPASEV